MKNTVENVDSFEFTKEDIPSSNWMKFSNVWDSIAGTFLGKEKKEWVNGFPTQIVYTLFRAYINGEKVEDEDAEYKFWIKEANKFINSQLSRVKEWQIFWIKFDKLVDSKSGMRPAKSYIVNIKGMDAKYVSDSTAEWVFSKDMPF